MNLIVNYYDDKNIIRRNELITSLLSNLLNPFIEKIYIVTDTILPNVVIFADTELKIRTINRKGIPTFKELFELANCVNNDYEITIIANLDISFDETLGYINDMPIYWTDCLAITRNDLRDSMRSDSQDVWIFKGFINEVENCDFTMGVAGCDNSIAYCLDKSGYDIINTAFKINCIHNHKSEIRNYIAGSEIKRMNPDTHPYLLVPINK